MQKRLEDLNQKIIVWGNDRKITTNGNVATQLLKLNEEFLKEFYESEGDEEKLKDAIGDSMVVLTMIDGITNKDGGVLKGIQYKKVEELVIDMGGKQFVADNDEYLIGFVGSICTSIGNLSAITVRNKIEEQKAQFNKYISDCYAGLMMLAFAVGLEPLDCLELAYNEIKDRKGELLPNGIFVKESDLKG
jgi:hypothetical protein